MLLPVEEGLDAGGIRQAVFDINRSEVSPEEFLSDNIYLFDWQTKELTIVNV